MGFLFDWRENVIFKQLQYRFWAKFKAILCAYYTFRQNFYLKKS